MPDNPLFDHVILTAGNILVTSNGPELEIISTIWNRNGGLALIFIASAFDNSPNTPNQFLAQIRLLNGNVEFQQSLGFPPNNVLQSVGTPPASTAKHEAFSSLWVGKINTGDRIRMMFSVTGDAGQVLINNNNTHMSILLFNPAG